jgi:hypothetical protein
MEPKTITVKNLDTLTAELIKGSEVSRGTYLYKGFRLQISSYQASGAERTSRLYHKRREGGLCIRCGGKITQKNPKTGKLYRLCAEHREDIDVAAAAGNGNGKGRKTAAKKVNKKK